jgi:hypothetical protein
MRVASARIASADRFPRMDRSGSPSAFEVYGIARGQRLANRIQREIGSKSSRWGWITRQPITYLLISTYFHTARCGVLRLTPRVELRVVHGHGRCARGARLLHGSRLHGVSLLPDGGERRSRDVQPPYYDGPRPPCSFSFSFRYGSGRRGLAQRAPTSGRRKYDVSCMEH